MPWRGAAEAGADAAEGGTGTGPVGGTEEGREGGARVVQVAVLGWVQAQERAEKLRKKAEKAC